WTSRRAASASTSASTSRSTPAPRPTATSVGHRKRTAASHGSGRTLSRRSAISPADPRDSMREEHDAQNRRLYGRRVGKPLSSLRASLFADNYPRLAVNVTAPRLADLSALFPH